MEEIRIFCPHCGDVNVLEVEWTFTGELERGCPSCGRVLRITVWRDEWGDPQVSVAGEAG